MKIHILKGLLEEKNRTGLSMENLALTNPERRLLAKMQGTSDDWDVEKVLSSCDWNDQAIAVSAGEGLFNKGLLMQNTTSSSSVVLGGLGEVALAEGLLEERLWNWIQSTESPNMGSLSQNFERSEAGPGIGLLKKLGVSIEGGVLVASDSDSVTKEIESRKAFLQSLPLDSEGADSGMIEKMKSRKGLIEISESKTRTWSITDLGNSVPKALLEEREIISEITPELLQSELWRNAEFRRFDVTLDSTIPRRGKSHPMQALIERIRSIFLEMGFSELVDDYVQTAGWNMDALFIPQDHPAREMQDTFYLDNPKSVEIEEKYLNLWKSVHEDGEETGSTGWQGEFSEEISKRGLLRTHTTVNTIQYLAQNPDKPCRVFSVDRVFRKEAIDRTHLPEFHQIEGIIMEEGANLAMLVDTLKTFYAKMGYPEVRVRPAYFPYTEPSLEIEVKWRGKWLELGGAGIFRPEVTEPLGVKHPVCAWGMGLERLAMLVLGLDDIRQLYISDLEWLNSQPIL